MVMLFFAHSGEVHESTAGAVSHGLLDNWYVALLVFIAAVLVVGTTTYFLARKSKATTLNVLLVTCLLAGIVTYTTSAIISVLSLSLGFGMALFQVIIGLSSDHKSNE